MKFMQQVGDGEISLEQGISENDAQNWSEEYLNVAGKGDGADLAENWAKEHTASTGKTQVRAQF